PPGTSLVLLGAKRHRRKSGFDAELYMVWGSLFVRRASQPCDLQDWKSFQTSKLASYRLGVWGGPRRGNRRGIREGKGSDLLVSSINKMITQRVADQFCGGGHVRLFQDVGAMRTHGRHTQVQFLSDLGHRFPQGDHPQDLKFSVR